MRVVTRGMSESHSKRLSTATQYNQCASSWKQWSLWNCHWTTNEQSTTFKQSSCNQVKSKAIVYLPKWAQLLRLYGRMLECKSALRGRESTNSTILHDSESLPLYLPHVRLNVFDCKKFTELISSLV